MGGSERMQGASIASIKKNPAVSIFEHFDVFFLLLRHLANKKAKSFAFEVIELFISYFLIAYSIVCLRWGWSTYECIVHFATCNSESRCHLVK